MKPKYTTEQLLEAIQASHFNLVVKDFDDSRVTVKLSWANPVILDIDDKGVFTAAGTSRVEDIVLSSIRTALHILFDNKEASY